MYHHGMVVMKSCHISHTSYANINDCAHISDGLRHADTIWEDLETRILLVQAQQHLNVIRLPHLIWRNYTKLNSTSHHIILVLSDMNVLNSRLYLLNLLYFESLFRHFESKHCIEQILMAVLQAFLHLGSDLYQTSPEIWSVSRMHFLSTQ